MFAWYVLGLRSSYPIRTLPVLLVVQFVIGDRLLAFLDDFTSGCLDGLETRTYLLHIYRNAGVSAVLYKFGRFVGHLIEFSFVVFQIDKKGLRRMERSHFEVDDAGCLHKQEVTDRTRSRRRPSPKIKVKNRNSVVDEKRKSAVVEVCDDLWILLAPSDQIGR